MMSNTPGQRLDQNVDQNADHSTNKNIDFGSALAKARRTKNYTIEEVCEQLKISARSISAIEDSDIENLPAPTFTQGYIRAYAKYLQVPVDSILDAYNRADPHEQTTSLKPRSNLPDEANSKSPLMLAVTILLILAGVAALIYGSFEYYQEKADVMETQRESKERSFTGNSLDNPGSHRLQIKQKARLTDDGELIVVTGQYLKQTAVDEDLDGVDNNMDVTTDNSKSINSDTVRSDNSGGAAQDQLQIFTENGAWVEVRDARNNRLIYNTVPAGGKRILTGKAPFRIIMGNASTNSLLINDLVIDMSRYIRENNTANFSVSSEGQQVIFH